MITLSLAVRSLLLIAGASRQTPQNCDSVVAAARSDSVMSGIFIAARGVTASMTREKATRMAVSIGTAFVPPRPLKLSVFGAAPVLRVLRTAGGDDARQLRAPDITGVYEVAMAGTDSQPSVRVARTSLIEGFDSAATAAIRSAATIRTVFAPAGSDDSMRVYIRFTSDSSADSQRLFAAYLPRMPVVDAAPREDNPPLQFPDAARADSLASGSVVLRFIVGRDGSPEPGTTEAVRFSSMVFLRAAAAALASQRFRPATIHGCPVAQVVDYPMSFFSPESPPDY